MARYRRILLKLSGEILAGGRGHGIDEQVIGGLAEEIRDVHGLGVQTGIVLGGGNIFRGLAASGRGMDRVAADHMGMLATVINSLALQHFLEHHGIHTRVMSAVEMNRVCEPYIRRRAVRHLEKGRVVILAAGTGNPYFTTDTAAALRAVEIGADAERLTSRLVGRLMCPGCGEIYNAYSRAPKREGVCDRCGKTLIHRSDDREDLIRERFRTYREETYPLVEYYQKMGVYYEVDGMRPIEDVTNEILSIVDKKKVLMLTGRGGDPSFA